MSASGAGVVGRGCLRWRGDVEVVEAHLLDEGRHLHLHLTRERMKPMTTVYHNMQLSHGGPPDKPAIPGQRHFELVRSHVHV